MKYIRKRKNGRYQCRIYTTEFKLSFTSGDLNEVISRRNETLGYNPDVEKKEPKILIFDIETSPILAYVWNIWNQNIGLSQIKKDWYILSFAYKWLGEDKSYFVGLSDFNSDKPDLIFYLKTLCKIAIKDNLTNEQIFKKLQSCIENFHNIEQQEKKLLLVLWDLFNEADIVVGHNGDAFDIKKVNSRFFFHKINKPSPFKSVDTLKIAKRNFKFTSNKLDYLAKYKGSAGKLQNNGMPLWIDCMNNECKAWKLMKEYNIQDVDELESIYLNLRGWDGSHPNLVHYYNDNIVRCTNCGNKNLIEVNNAVTSTRTYPAWQCNNCGHYMRGRKNNTDKNKEILVSVK